VRDEKAKIKIDLHNLRLFGRLARATTTNEIFKILNRILSYYHIRAEIFEWP
jgi:hypothetical protein